MSMIKFSELEQVNVVSRSLGAIRDAHMRLDDLENVSATPAILASRIQLCNVLLQEISGIRKQFRRDLQGRHLEQSSAGSHVARHH